jgi:hypothetical protein
MHHPSLNGGILFGNWCNDGIEMRVEVNGIQGLGVNVD